MHALSLRHWHSGFLTHSTRHGEYGIATCMQTSIPQFAAQEALQQLNASIIACYSQLGPKAEIDGVGGCGCTRGFVVSGACSESWLPAPANSLWSEGDRSAVFESGASRPMVQPGACVALLLRIVQCWI